MSRWFLQWIGRDKPILTQEVTNGPKVSSSFVASRSNIDGTGNLNVSLALPCDRPWPNLELLVPVHMIRDDAKDGMIDPRRYELFSLFLRSYMLFWPKASLTSLNVLYDSEDSNSYHFEETQELLAKYAYKLPGPYRLTPNSPSNYQRRGYDRQQRLMFWADNFTTAEFVGFADSDCVFETYVDREDLFENGKPVVNGRSGM
jgi:hypothetical protein